MSGVWFFLLIIFIGYFLPPVSQKSPCTYLDYSTWKFILTNLKTIYFNHFYTKYLVMLIMTPDFLSTAWISHEISDLYNQLPIWYPYLLLLFISFWSFKTNVFKIEVLIFLSKPAIR